MMSSEIDFQIAYGALVSSCTAAQEPFVYAAFVEFVEAWQHANLVPFCISVTANSTYMLLLNIITGCTTGEEFRQAAGGRPTPFHISNTFAKREEFFITHVVNVQIITSRGLRRLPIVVLRVYAGHLFITEVLLAG